MDHKSYKAIIKARIEFGTNYEGFSIADNAKPEFTNSGCEVCNISANEYGGAGDVFTVNHLATEDIKAKLFTNPYESKICAGCLNSLANGDDSDLDYSLEG